MNDKNIKKLEFISIILILIFLIQNFIFIILPVKSLAASNTINTILGDVTLKTDATRLKAGDIIPIEIHIGGENIVQFSGYLNYDQNKFKKLDSNTDIETLRGWGAMEGEETEYGTELFIFSQGGNSYACSNCLLATIYFTVTEDTDIADFSIKFVNIVNTNFEDNMDEDFNLPDISLKIIANNEKLYLTSEAYKIGNNDIKNYETGDTYISRVIRNTSKDIFTNNLKTNGTIRVLKQDGTELGETEMVGTDMTLEVTKDDEKIALKIAVMGDLSGDGMVTAQDLSRIKDVLLGKDELNNSYFVAADFDETNEMKTAYLSEINHMCLE